MTSDEQHELSALLGKATGAHCYLTLAQKQRLRDLLNKRNNQKEIINDDKASKAIN